MRSDKPAGMNADFLNVVDALPGLVWTTLPDFRSDFVNRGWREYTGQDKDDATGLGWQTAIHPDDRSTVVLAWELIYQSNPLKGARDVAKELEARLLRFDGEYRWF